MEKGKTLKGINRSYHGHMRSLTKAGRERDILAALANGKNTYMRMDRLESSSFDSSWIEVIEDVIFDLGEIIANPRQNTKTEGNIVPVELARKTSAESVQHLASHTQYVKEIDEYGNVIPSKVLTMIHEDDIRTYENRFIATFVRRLVLFIEKRYEFVSKFAELHDESVLMFKNKSIVDGAEVEIETKIRINHKSDDEVSLKSNEYVERIKEMRRYILYFYNSDFMKQLKTERDVHNPILQTNIIRKNPLYHHCYEVYRFIEKYEHLGVHYKVDEQYSVFNAQELAEINHTLFANYITLKGKERPAVTKGSTKVYKPKILTSPDDDAFIYGPLYAGPIEFLRTDKPYQDYLDSKVRKDLPLHPTKKEKEYYAEEYAQKAENKEDLKQKNDLIRRKEKEIAAFNKLVAKIEAEREAARLALLEEEKRIIQQEENDLLTAARNEIIAASLEDQGKAELLRLKDEIASTTVIEASHPYSEPVTYEEAVLDIWPQTANAPSLRVAQEDEEEPIFVSKQEEPQPEEVVEEVPTVEEAPVVEETPVAEPEVEEVTVFEETKEEEAAPVSVESQPTVVEPSHPYSEPVSYDEATLEIWPQIKDAPVLRVAPKEEPVKKEQPAPAKKESTKAKKAEKVQPKPADVPQYEHPYTKPVSYDEAALEIWPNLAKAPALRVAPKEEKPAPAPKKETSAKKPVVKPAPKKEQPKVEPKKEQKAAPNKPATVKEAPEKKPEPVKVEKKIPAKVAPVKKTEPKEPVKRVAVRVEEKPREKIPGRFIVKLNTGYYVNTNKVSEYKEDAYVFDDFNLAKDVKKEKGGKIIKL